MKLTSVAVLAVATVGLPLVSAGQTPPSIRRVVGHSIAEQLQFDARTNSTTDTVTLAFKTNDGAPALTVDFVARYATERPARPPVVVDMIVTERLLEDDDPQMTMRVDGEPFPLIGRVRSRRSVVATMAFDDFVRLSNAERIVERAFNTELEFGQVQIRMLQATAAKWSGR